MQFQIMLTLIAILGASATALLIDILRRKNREVREAGVAQRVREAERWHEQPRIVETAPETQKVQEEPPLNSRQALSRWLDRQAVDLSSAKPSSPAKTGSIRARAADSGLQLIQKTHFLSDLGISAGFQDARTTERLRESRTPFNGLVVSIGIDAEDPDLAESAGSFLQTLVRATDLACQVGNGEYLLICPGDMGSAGQRRLRYLSERLWDYQLEWSSDNTPWFSLAAVQAHKEPLAEAIASATESMTQTRRNRNRQAPTVRAQSRAV